MTGFLTRRLTMVAVLLLGFSILGFAILRLAPGGPYRLLRRRGDMSQDDMDRLAVQMGLNAPLPVQYFHWLGNMLIGDWGRSYRDQIPVLAVIGSRVGATLVLMLTSTVIRVAIGGWIGVMSGINRGSKFDTTSSVVLLVLVSIPTFWLGLVSIYLFALKLGWLPAGGREDAGGGSLLDVLQPIAAGAGLGHGASCRLEPIHAAFRDRRHHTGLCAYGACEGVSEAKILWRHVLPNSLLPMISIAGMHLPAQLGGALVTETVFSWPGMGRLFMDSLNYRDYPVVLGILMLTAVLTLLGSLIADICYVVVDPRVRPT